MHSDMVKRAEERELLSSLEQRLDALQYGEVHQLAAATEPVIETHIEIEPEPALDSAPPTKSETKKASRRKASQD